MWCVCRRTKGALFCHSLSHSLEKGCPTKIGPGLAARKLQWSSCLCSQAGYSCTSRYTLFFYICAGDLNSASHASTAIALTYGVISSILMVAFLIYYLILRETDWMRTFVGYASLSRDLGVTPKFWEIWPHPASWHLTLNILEVITQPVPFQGGSRGWGQEPILGWQEWEKGIDGFML